MGQLRERRRSWIGFIRVSAAAFGAALLNLFPFCGDLPRSCLDEDKQGSQSVLHDSTSGGTSMAANRRCSGKKLFGCDCCGKFLSTHSNLKVHMRSHTGERPFCCKVCKKAFAAYGTLKNHRRVHEIVKEFGCDFCGKQFSYKHALKGHVRSHTGERPYSCVVCKKDFAHQGNLTTHLQSHQVEKPLKCLVCGKGFTQASGVQRHLRKQHKTSPSQYKYQKKRLTIFPLTAPEVKIEKSVSQNSAGLSLANKSKKSDLSPSVPVQFDDTQSVESFEAEEDLLCTLCDKPYKVRGWLMQHLLKVHNVTPETFKNDILRGLLCGVPPSVPTENPPNSCLQGALVEDGGQNRAKSEEGEVKVEIGEVRLLSNENGQAVFVSPEEEKRLQKKVKFEHDLAGSGAEGQSNPKEVEHDQVHFDSTEDDQKFPFLSLKKGEPESEEEEEEQIQITMKFEPDLSRDVPEIKTEIVSD